MLKKTIKYPDLDGNEVVEDFYFNLNKAEIAEMELSQKGGLAAYLQKIVASEDGGEIIATFKEIIMKSVGRRAEDGRRFVKSDEITNEFMQTEAYSQMFMELVTDADAALDFVKGILPRDLAEEVGADEKPKDDVPAYILEKREPTRKELEQMSPAELQEAFRRKNIHSVE